MMTRTLLSIAALLLVTTWIVAADQQSAPASPTFDVASVKKSPPPGNGGVFINAGSRKGTSWNATNATLRSLVRTANGPRYQMEGQIVGGPVWVDDDRFDITAKLDPAATQDGMTMEALVSSLSRFTGRPVLDRTGLAGYYALTLEFAAEPGVASPLGGVAGPATAPPPDAASIFSAVVDQLGLKLDARREPTEVLVIDRAEQPTPD